MIVTIIIGLVVISITAVMLLGLRENVYGFSISINQALNSILVGLLITLSIVSLSRLNSKAEVVSFTERVDELVVDYQKAFVNQDMETVKEVLGKINVYNTYLDNRKESINNIWSGWLVSKDWLDLEPTVPGL